MSDTKPAGTLHRFSHEAMHTYFTIIIGESDAGYADSAAQEAFKLLDRLEGRLSRFIPSSDIARVNALAVDEEYLLDSDAWDCLEVAADMAQRTGRAFDPVAGRLIDFWKAQPVPLADVEGNPDWEAAWQEHSQGQISLDPERRAARCVTPGSKLDLGAIGKGFALDLMAKFLEEDWDISRALLSAGGSTVLALDAPEGRQGWKIGFGGEKGQFPPLALVRQALSSSGTELQPTHLVDPRTGMVVTRLDLVRALAATAADADALSTAFFVFSREETEQYCAENHGHIALLEKPDGSGLDVIGGGEVNFWE